MGSACVLGNTSQSTIIDYLASWPGTILDWSDVDMMEFAACFKARKVSIGKEVRLKYLLSILDTYQTHFMLVQLMVFLPAIRYR